MVDENYSNSLESITKFLIGGLMTLLSTVLLALIGQGLLFLNTGELSLATVYANFISGLATILLLGITFWYAFETRRMAGQMELQVAQERKRQQRELTNMRRALKYEIQMLPSRDQLTSFEIGDAQETMEVAPTTVFKQNAQQLGRLTEDEVNATLEYYYRVAEFNSFLEAFRRGEARSRPDRMATLLTEAQEEAINTLDANLAESN